MISLNPESRIPNPILRGLYAITSEAICRDQPGLITAVECALDGGAALIQYRDKWNTPIVRNRYARTLTALCHARHVPLIINDDPQLAADCGADGVHLGASDATFERARVLLGSAAIIGVTCGNRIERAVDAQEAGASYVSFGRFFASRTKPEAPPAEPSLLLQARPRVHIPMCAIGGLTPANAAPLIAAGADLIAAVGGVFGAPDVEAAAQAYSQLFSQVSS